MIDLIELEKELRKMKPRQALYETVRRVLKEQGRWKNAPRGKPQSAATLQRNINKSVEPRIIA